jgi:hypothetical protein
VSPYYFKPFELKEVGEHVEIRIEGSHR